MSVLRTVAHRRIRFIFFFITGFRTFPANHRIALRTQESSSLLRKAETCLFFLHRHTRFSSLMRQSIAESHIIITHPKNNSQLLSLLIL